MRWINANSVEELKTFGKFTEVKNGIKQDLGGVVNITGRSWNNLYEKIVKFRKILEPIVNQQKQRSDNLSKNNDSIFTSKANEYIFYLTELDGEIRMKKLGITKSHFTNKKKSKTWRDKISKEIHPDINTHPKAHKAMAKLNEIYSSMVGKE